MNRTVAHRWIAWLSVIALALQVNAVPLYYTLFEVNQQDIARTECERKQPHCNGHCYLMKQLAKTTNDNEKHSTRAEVHFDHLFAPRVEGALNLDRPIQQSSLTPYRAAVSNGWAQALLHPPCFA